MRIKSTVNLCVQRYRKTRLSREFKRLIVPKDTETEEQEDARAEILYYNAFTEDLFYWDNDLNADTNRKLKYNQTVLQIGYFMIKGRKTI